MSSGDMDSMDDYVERTKRALRLTPGGGGGRRGDDGIGLESHFSGDDPRQLLVQMLVTAARLEFATIPPYLCALWSIEDELDPTAESIREVVQEEMLHLALVCNLLAALGVAPDFFAWAPRYPTKLPGGVHADLTVHLQGFSKEALFDFIRIESPESLPPNVDKENGDPYWPEGQRIGQFYEAILALFRDLQPPLITTNQVTGPLSWRSIATLADVEWAIRLIQHQGEGAVAGPLDSGKKDLAHYYRFLELWKGKQLQFDKAERHFYWRGKLQAPAHRNMGRVPEGGYKDVDNPQVAIHLLEFDRVYEALLVDMNKAWRGPTGQGSLVHAYKLMFKLGGHARPLMKFKRPDLAGFTYGPQFTPPKRP